MTSVYVTQLLRNTGSDCVLELPATIGVASATSPLRSVEVTNAGTAPSVTIRAEESVSIVLGAWWWVRGPCTDPITDVTRVEFPIARDSIQIDSGTVWHQACSSPASVLVTIKDSRQ